MQRILAQFSEDPIKVVDTLSEEYAGRKVSFDDAEKLYYERLNAVRTGRIGKAGRRSSLSVSGIPRMMESQQHGDSSAWWERIAIPFFAIARQLLDVLSEQTDLQDE